MITVFFISPQDSTILTKLKELGDQLAVVDKKASVTPWITLIVTVIAGILLWVGQAIERRSKRQTEDVAKRRALFEKSESLRMQIKGLLRQLVYYNYQSVYWWYCYETEYALNNTDEVNNGKETDNTAADNIAGNGTEQEDQYLYKHYSTCDSIAGIRFKLDTAIAEYYGAVGHLLLLADNRTIDISFVPGLIVTEWPEVVNMDTTLSDQQALQFVHENIPPMTARYLATFAELDTLSEKLKHI